MTGTLRGYARISTTGQKLDLQLDALAKAGVMPDNVYQDTMSGKYESRPALDRLRADLQPGDTVVTWKLDRLGRSLSHLVQLSEEIRAKGCFLRAITNGIDTSTPSGRMFFGVLSTLAEYEREIIQERVIAGLEAARARNVRLGPPVKMTAAKTKAAEKLIASGQAVKDVARVLEVDRSTLYRALNRE